MFYCLYALTIQAHIYIFQNSICIGHLSVDQGMVEKYLKCGKNSIGTSANRRTNWYLSLEGPIRKIWNALGNWVLEYSVHFVTGLNIGI